MWQSTFFPLTLFPSDPFLPTSFLPSFSTSFNSLPLPRPLLLASLLLSVSPLPLLLPLLLPSSSSSSSLFLLLPSSLFFSLLLSLSRVLFFPSVSLTRFIFSSNYSTHTHMHCKCVRAHTHTHAHTHTLCQSHILALQYHFSTSQGHCGTVAKRAKKGWGEVNDLVWKRGVLKAINMHVCLCEYMCVRVCV